MVWINLPALPMLRMKIPIQHVHGHHVYRHFALGALEHLENNLTDNMFSNSIIAVVEYRHIL